MTLDMGVMGYPQNTWKEYTAFQLENYRRNYEFFINEVRFISPFMEAAIV